MDLRFRCIDDGDCVCCTLIDASVTSLLTEAAGCAMICSLTGVVWSVGGIAGAVVDGLGLRWAVGEELQCRVTYVSVLIKVFVGECRARVQEIKHCARRRKIEA